MIMKPSWDPCGTDQPPAVDQENAERFLNHLLGSARCSDPDAELRKLALIVDLSEDSQSRDGLDAALATGDELLRTSLNARQSAELNYFLSNAWEAVRRLNRKGTDLHAWEQPELGRQIIHLRRAVRLASLDNVGPIRLRQMYTNLGNLMSHCGRVVEAILAWDHALEASPQFGMALANRAQGLVSYAQLVPDPGHRICHFREAYRSISTALGAQLADIQPTAKASFESLRDYIDRIVPRDELSGSLPSKDYTLEWSSEEREYREWCLLERLFLNDLNDLNLGPIAAIDILSLPSVTTSVQVAQPGVLGFFNQLKQEFVSARYLYFDGMASKKRYSVHYADRGVTLINTLDYPVYCLSIEKVKIAFRVAYSIFDKIAYFLNDYLKLDIPAKRVSFRSLWYVRGDPQCGLRQDLGEPENRGMMGLYWLAKDLYESEEEFAEAIEPEARELATIRHHLEHKYLKLHAVATPETTDGYKIGFEELAYSLTRRDFEAKTLRILQLTRSALIYLVQAVLVEEHQRHSTAKGLAMPMFVDTWDDDWKF